MSFREKSSFINVSWVMEFLTSGDKINLILSKKKIMGFNEIAVFYELT